ncbi:hypothetical protein TNCV_1017491 [Trichonephila clavipes]|uniref:Uncharacterized protein n=1 Tax=Trichonephila clavipes TaxID=2585209 RepID=A0A8X6VYB5_TRICX|nr:hypothetical protein TNCV_1017491 [Trichonephila clavipes]
MIRQKQRGPGVRDHIHLASEGISPMTKGGRGRLLVKVTNLGLHEFDPNTAKDKPSSEFAMTVVLRLSSIYEGPNNENGKNQPEDNKDGPR